MSQITTLPCSLEADLPAFARAGFTAVELSLEKVNRYVAQHSVAALREMLDSLGLKANGAIGLAPAGPALLLSRGTEFDAYLNSLRQQLWLCQALGAEQLGVGADAAKWLQDPGWQQGAMHNLAVAARLAQDHGIRIGLEFMSLAEPIGPFVLESLATTRQLTAAVGHPAVGINIDFFHHFRSGGTVAELASLRADEIVDIHVTDATDGPRDSLGDGNRVLPGHGAIPLDRYRDAVLSTGYDGFWVLELLNEPLWQRDVGEVAALGLASMQQFRGEPL